MRFNAKTKQDIISDLYFIKELVESNNPQEALKSIEELSKFVLNLKVGIDGLKMKNIEDKVISQAKKLKELNDAINTKNINISHLNSRYQFITKRIKQVCGHEKFIEIMNHVECPNNFDAENYRRVNEIQ